MSLRQKIEEEIKRLSSFHEEETINLINNVLRPMLLYIKKKKKLMTELTRISAKHGI